MGPTPPYRIVTERLVLRCWQPTDAAALIEVMRASREHLLPWLPWAEAEPQPLPEKVKLLRRFRGQFDLDQDYIYGIFDRATEAIVGGTGLHTRCGAGGFEIGYWIAAGSVGRGYATEATKAMVRVGLEHMGADRIEIRCEPANEPSNVIPRRLGFLEEGILRSRRVTPDQPPRDHRSWVMLREDYDATGIAESEFTGFDAAGQPLEFGARS